MRTLIVLCCALFAGCAGSITPSQLEPPAAVLLVPPKPLAAPKPGDDLVQLYRELRRDASTDKDRLRRLQKYVRTILKK
jgi:hypothetical protein